MAFRPEMEAGITASMERERLLGGGRLAGGVLALPSAVMCTPTLGRRMTIRSFGCRSGGGRGTLPADPRGLRWHLPIVTASGDKTVRIWDLSSGETIQVLQGHTGSVRTAAFTHRGVTSAW